MGVRISLWAQSDCIVQSSIFILRSLSGFLHKDLGNAVFEECFSCQQDEIVLVFTKRDLSPFYIKGFLKDTFQCIHIPSEISKPRHNVHPYFTDVYGLSVVKVYSGTNDRSLVIELTDGSSIVFKMYGNRSNVLLTSDNKVCEIIKKVHVRDMDFSLQTIHKQVEFHEDQSVSEILKPLYLSEYAAGYLREQVNLSVSATNTIQDLYNHFFEANEFYIHLNNNNIFFCLWNNDSSIYSSKDLYDVLNVFVQFYFRYNLFQERKLGLEGMLKKKILAAEKYIVKTTEQLKLLNELVPPNETADIIMANLHDWKAGVKERELYDFYRNKMILIQLKDRLSPQKMAEQLYKKSKNRFKQFSQLEKILDERKSLQIQYSSDLMVLSEHSDYKQLQTIELKYQKEDKAIKEVFPFKRYDVKGFDIWVGRNAANNELLTLKYAHKDDLWLHARDVPGSHVIIKFQSGKTFPQDVIEQAASLAAYYSTRKNDSLCPVSYTQKKYVRKFKGGAIGSIKMDREDVVMVVPKEIDKNK
jgi:predicted ribosome quality control (RQC) complex YloA/Tae2 family protein